MTPQEKAKELFLKYAMYIRAGYMFDEEADEDAKQCALIAVDEISWILNEISHNSNIESEMYFYQEVKQEIEKI